MTIPVVPSQFRVPAKGLVEINQLFVTVSSYSLGQSAQAYYDLQNVDAEGKVTSYGLNGNDSLTEEQFAGWGTDDQYFARCIAQNLGLTPVV